jgi:hypothetical protein
VLTAFPLLGPTERLAEMSITLNTANSTNLLSTFKKGIDDGHVVTWSYDSDGDFTHTPPQWNKKAYLRPTIIQGALVMKFLGHKNNVTWEVYAVYHGRFIESMIAHCHELFTDGAATAKPSVHDNIQA